MSDHLPVCIVRKHRKTRTQPHTISYRKWRNTDGHAFLDDLLNAPWTVLDMYEDPEDAVQYFNRTFVDVADAHVPLVKKKVKRQRQPIWMTPAIHGQLTKRDRLVKRARNVDTEESWAGYKEQRNAAFRAIRDAKSAFFKDAIERSKNSKDFWKVLKNAMGPNEKPSVSSVKREEFVIHDPEDIANTFNEFFASVASKYRSSSGGNADLKALKEFVQAKMPSSYTFEIPQISESFIMQYLSSIQPNKATGLDG